jgi:hypothetical protein
MFWKECQVKPQKNITMNCGTGRHIYILVNSADLYVSLKKNISRGHTLFILSMGEKTLTAVIYDSLII